MRSHHRVLLPAAGLVVVSVLGCASTPLERARQERDAGPTSCLPRSVALVVKLDAGPGGLYGTSDEWREDLRRAVLELDACAQLLPEERQAEADMILTVWLSRSRSIDPDIQAPGAFLDFLAWSTIPFLPLWIPDVSIQPELQVRVERLLESPEAREALAAMPADPDAVSTCYLDRRPFFSWPTLGALFVPPFVFSGTDPAHVEAEIGGWVREATAVEVANVIRASQPRAGELLDGLAVEPAAGSGSALDLSFRPGPRLRQVVATVAGVEVGRQDIILSETAAAPSPTVQLRLDLEVGEGAPAHVSVLAIGNRPGQSVRYTVRVPVEAPANPATGGGAP